MNYKFIPELVETNISAKNKEEVIRFLAKKLADRKCVSSHYSELVLQREKEYPTGLITKGAVIAIPHAFDPETKGNNIAIGILKTPVGFKHMEDIDETVPVKIVFMLAINDSHEHMEMLKILMQLVRDEELFKKLQSISSKNEICKLLNEYIETLES